MDINLELYDSVSLLDYIDGTNDFQYIELVDEETGGLVADVKYNITIFKGVNYNLATAS